MRTWHVELAVAAALVALGAWFAGGGFEWLAAAGVMATFGHVQIATRYEERDRSRPAPLVECGWKMKWYWVAKESFWVCYFIARESWAGLIGCAMLLAYPAWRTWHRRARATP